MKMKLEHRVPLSGRCIEILKIARETSSGEFVFTGGWGQRARIWVNRMSDGGEVGVLDPGPTVGGVQATGWIDILTGITACRRSDGEYLVFVEEDYRGKAVLYRWRPRG